MVELMTHSLEETQSLAASLADLAEPGLLIRLEGSLGTGKTAFTQGFGRALGVTRAIKSPTFNIVKTYLSDKGPLVHIDAYRLEMGGSEEIDWEYYLTDQSLVLVEWAQFMEDFLPKDYLLIEFTRQSDQERLIRVTLPQVKSRYQDLVTTWLNQWQKGRL